MTIEQLEEEIEAANEYNEDVARRNFTEETGRELSDSCDVLTRKAKKRIATIKRGELPRAFGAYDHDEIARVFSTITLITFDAYDIDMGIDVAKIDKWQDGAVKTFLTMDAEEEHGRRVFIDCYEEYLYTAATFAKSIGSAAVRPYLMAWRLAKEIGSPYAYGSSLPEKALRLVKLEKAAYDLLWLDATIANLPKFKATKPRRKRKA